MGHFTLKKVIPDTPAESTRIYILFTLAMLTGWGVVVSLISQIPEYMNHWDEFQLAYGVVEFDLTRHHPHPPGYYLFIVAGRLFMPMIGDPTFALQLVSILGIGGLAVVLIFHLSTQLRSWSLVIAACALSAWILGSPLVRLYGTVGLSYATEGVIWTIICLAMGRKPTRWGLWILSFGIGFAGGIRQTLMVWGVALFLIKILRHRYWIPLKHLPTIGMMMGLGLLGWFVPMLCEVGGFTAWHTASANLVTGNIWAKSLFHTGLRGLSDRVVMLKDLWLGLGPLLLLIPVLFVARMKGKLTKFDSLLMGWVLAFGFYGLLIYDTMGYMMAPVLVLGTWIILSCAELLSDWPVKRQVMGGSILLGVVLLFPLAPGLVDDRGDDIYNVYQRHDAELKRRFNAIEDEVKSGRITPERTVLITSYEYWQYGLRHVAHYLPEFTTVQLAIDTFFQIAKPDSPYLVSKNRRLKTAGPNGLAVSSLLDGEKLDHLIYMVPFDFQQFIDHRCAPFARFIESGSKERLILIEVPEDVTPIIKNQRLLCDR